MRAKELRRLRCMAGLTQEQAARLCGVAHRTILRWEHGDSRIGDLLWQAIRIRLVSQLFQPQKGEEKAD